MGKSQSLHYRKPSFHMTMAKTLGPIFASHASFLALMIPLSTSTLYLNGSPMTNQLGLFKQNVSVSITALTHKSIQQNQIVLLSWYCYIYMRGGDRYEQKMRMFCCSVAVLIGLYKKNCPVSCVRFDFSLISWDTLLDQIILWALIDRNCNTFFTNKPSFKNLYVLFFIKQNVKRFPILLILAHN